MTTVVTMEGNLQSLAAVKAEFSRFVESAERTHERVIVTKNGRPAAVLIGIEDYEAMVETLEVLSDADAMRAVAEARADEREAIAPQDEASFLEELRAAGRLRRPA